jgi:pyruvate kinase
MTRHTKIVATLGPASNDADVLEKLIRAGVDIVRLNFSHGTADDHVARARVVREAAARVGRPVGILADLQGPKIRVGKFTEGKVVLENGARFILDANCTSGTLERVGLDYKDLPKDVKNGDVLLLDDGRIVLDVERVAGAEIHTVVRHGGDLSNNKGINRQGGGLSAPALTAKDMEDIKTAASIGVDYVAISFPKSAADMYMARQLMRAAGGHALTIAKIERVEAVASLDEILDASDGVMVARGDLAVEVGDAAVPALQKKMIRMARERNKLAITATQMMESMILSPVPTRAEVSDVANAVLDGTDAVMLSAEDSQRQIPDPHRRSHGPRLPGSREIARSDTGPRVPRPRLHPHRSVNCHGRHLDRAPPQGEGHRRTDRVRLNGAVDEPAELRRTDLCADALRRCTDQDVPLP